MTQILKIETGYVPEPPPLSKAEKEREDLRDLALAALSDEQFGKTFRFMTDLFKYLKFAAGQATIIDR